MLVIVLLRLFVGERKHKFKMDYNPTYFRSRESMNTQNSPQHDVDMGKVVGGSGEMFNKIAHRYDLLNRVLSFGFDRSWRRMLVKEATEMIPGRVLDIATGTGDVAIALAKTSPKIEVIGLDLSVEMLKFGRKKVEKQHLSHRVTLIEGDAQELPFDDSSFCSCTIAFGIRNVPDRMKGLREMARVVRPGGKVVILELTEPRTGRLAPLTRFHVHHVVPRIGAFVSGAKEYRYLQESVQSFPDPEAFSEMMREAGIHQIQTHRMSFGVAYLHVGKVAESGDCCT